MNTKSIRDSLKYHYIILILLIFSAPYSFAQRVYGGGVQVGGTLSAMSADNITGYWKAGFTTGLFAYVTVFDNSNTRMKLQMELNFTTKGTRTMPHFHDSGINRLENYILHLGYLEIPILARLRFNNISLYDDGLWLDFGPAIGILLDQREMYRIRDFFEAGSGKDFKSIDFSFQAGLTYAFKQHHGISIRFSHSLLPIGSPTMEITQGLLKRQYNSGFGLTYSYKF